MKKLFILGAMLFPLFTSAQSVDPPQGNRMKKEETIMSTQREIDEINLRLEMVEKFGTQHRAGNTLTIIGGCLSLIGSQVYISNILENNNSGALFTEGMGAVLLGTITMGTGVIINIDSYRHLKFEK